MGRGWSRAAPAQRREIITVGLLLLLALVLRIAIARLDHVLQGDEGAYLWLGKTLLSTGEFSFFGRPELHYAPFYPIVSGLVWLVVGDLETASKVCFVLFGTLGLIPVYLIARTVYGRLEGYAAMALLAVLPAITTYVFYWGSMTEPLYYFLLFWGAYFGLLALRGGRWTTYGTAGGLFGLAYLTRPEGVVIVAGVWLFLLLARLAEGSGRLRSLASLTLMLATFLLVASPYLLYLRAGVGAWTVSGKPWMAYMQLRTLDMGDPVTFDKVSWGLDSTGVEVMYHSQDKFTQSLVGEVLAAPATYLGQMAQNARQLDGIFLSKRVLPFFLLPLLGLALCSRCWDRRRLWDELYLALLLALPILSLLPFAYVLRFLLGSMYILMIWVGRGLVELGRWAGGTLAALRSGYGQPRWESGITVAGTALLALYFIAVQPGLVRDGQAQMHFHYKAAGEWLAENTPADATVMARGAIVAVHAHRDWVPFPHASYAEVLTYARHHGVDYFVVNQHEYSVMRPQLAFLADPAQTPAELELVWAHEGRTGRTVVQRLRPAGD